MLSTQSSFTRPALISIASVLGLSLTSALAIATAAVGVEPTQTTAADSSEYVGSEALVTQPAQASTSDLLNVQSDGIDIEDSPTLIFMFDETIISPRDQIEENKPANSNAIHFPLES